MGYKYETPDGTPQFEAKGIETVRRDGTLAEQRIEERCLRILFEKQDLSAVKAYFQKECYKILTNRISVEEFFFAKEVKLGTYR